MELIKQFFGLIYYYEENLHSGKPYWRDPAFIGLAVSVLATELLKYAGININSDLQLKIVGVITGLGVAFSPHTGVKKLEQEEGPSVPTPNQMGAAGL